jgi:hypothetical protein
MMTKKTYNANDVMQMLKLTKSTTQKELRMINAPKDEMGYYNWTKPQYDRIIKAIREMRST